MENASQSVSQIIVATGLSQPLVSFHLKVLRDAGLVKTFREGTFVYNELSDVELIALIHKFEKYRLANESECDPSFSCPCPPWTKNKLQ